MNLPNKLTILRICLVPVAMAIFFIEPLQEIYLFNGEVVSLGNVIIIAIMALASLTDLLDGKIARKYNLITNLGKFLDPLADKMMTVAGFGIILVQCLKLDLPIFTWWMLVIIMVREFMVAGVRMMAAVNKTVIAANIFGKVKTVLQFALLLVVLVFTGAASKDVIPSWLVVIGYVLSYAMIASTVLSGVIYLVQNKGVLSEN